MDTGSHGAVPLEALLAESAWLRRLATSLVRDPAAAEDLVQETWLAALKNPPTADRPLRPWLRTVLENFVRMRARGEQARTTRERREAREEATQGEVELVERVEEQRFLAREVLKLEEPFRSTLVLRYYEGLSSIQIAERVGSNDNTVRWRLKRGLELLRERLDRRHAGDRGAWLALLAPLTPQDLAPVVAPPASANSGVGVWLAGAAAMLAFVAGVWFAVREPEHEEQLAALANTAASAEQPTNAGSRTAVERNEAAGAPASTALAPARIRGRVLDARSEPVSGAEALLELGEAKGPRGVSNADGVLELEVAGDSVLASSDALALSASGFEPLRVYAPVRPGETLELGDLVLRRTGAIQGSVRDAGGAPIEAAEVRLERLGERFGSLREPPLTEILLTGAGLEVSAPVVVESDVDGRFRLQDVAEAYYRVWIRAEGFARQCSGPLGVQQGGTFVLEPFVLAPPAPERLLRGVVLDAHGAPVANASVVGQRATLRHDFGPRRSDVRAVTDLQGRFTLVAEPSKPYFVLATEGARFAVGEQLVGEPAELSLQLRDWPMLELALGDTPVGELSIRGPEASGAGAPFTCLVAENVLAVRVERLEPFHLSVGRGQFHYFSRELNPSQLPARIDLGAPEVKELNVRVVAQGKPVADAWIALEIETEEHGWRTPAVSATTDRAGCATVAWCGRTIKEVKVYAAGWPVYTLSGAPPVGARLDVELARGGSLAGTVRDRLGRPVRGAYVTAGGWGGAATTDIDGAFRIDGLEPGRRSVDVSSPSILDERRKFPEFAGEPSHEVEIQADRVTRHDVRLLETQMCLLHGRVALDGSADGPRIVELVRPGQKRAVVRGRTDPNGDFELAVHDPGFYQLRCDTVANGGVRSELRQRVNLVRGVTLYRLEAPSATLLVKLAVAAAPEHELSVVVDTPPDGVWTAIARFDAEGRARVRVPSGRCRVAVEGVEHPELALDLRAGETREILWPPR